LMTASVVMGYMDGAGNCFERSAKGFGYSGTSLDPPPVGEGGDWAVLDGGLN
jgi:hypothetical protein